MSQDNVLFHAFKDLRKRVAAKNLYQLDQLLLDAGLTIDEWYSLDDKGREAYRRLFAPPARSKAWGEQDYDGDGGRGWRDDRGLE